MRAGDLVRRTGGLGADGQLGRLVENEDGVLMVKLNRAAQEMLLPLRGDEWTLATEDPLTPMQIAGITYDADRRLRLFTGGFTIPEWISLKDGARQAWLRGGPPADASDVRQRLYRAMVAELRR